MATNAQDITVLLQKLVEPIQKLNVLLQQDRISYNMIEGEVESLRMKKEKALEEFRQLQTANAQLRITGDGILSVARKQAEEVMGTAKAKNTESLALLEEVRDYVKGLDKKRWNDLNKSVLEVAMEKGK